MPSEKPCHPECTDSGPLTRLSPGDNGSNATPHRSMRMRGVRRNASGQQGPGKCTRASLRTLPQGNHQGAVTKDLTEERRQTGGPGAARCTAAHTRGGDRLPAAGHTPSVAPPAST